MKNIVDHYPEECSGCGREFTDSEKVPRIGAGRHQVAELLGTPRPQTQFAAAPKEPSYGKPGELRS
jgi:hypothetical protein